MRAHASGTINGTGAALTVCLGFLPDWVRIWNLEDGAVAEEYWNKDMRAAEAFAGYSFVEGTTYISKTERTVGTNIGIYRGGDKLASASTVYHYRDPNPDKRTSSTYGTIRTWTLGHAGNRTGNFNLEADTTYVNEGSRIRVHQDVDQKVLEASILSITSNGEQANEVTLSEALKSGQVRFISGFADYIGMPAGAVTLDGFSLAQTSVINVSGELCAFAAGCWD